MTNPATQFNTAVNIDSLQPGPEMDGLIEKRIFKSIDGLVFCKCDKPIYTGVYEKLCAVCEKFIAREFSKSHDLAYEMETEIERQGWHHKYIAALLKVVLESETASMNFSASYDAWWAFRHASAFQCCKAALKAGMEEGIKHA